MKPWTPGEYVAACKSAVEQSEARLADGRGDSLDATRVKLAPLLARFVEAGIEGGAFDPDLPLFPEEDEEGGDQ